MTLTAITTTPDGNTTCRTWTVTEEVRVLEHLCHVIGAAVDVVTLSPQVGMWIADDGGSGGAGYNPVATAIAATYGHGHRRYSTAGTPPPWPPPAAPTPTGSPQL